MASWSGFGFSGWDPISSFGEYSLADYFNRRSMSQQYKYAIKGMKEAPSARVEGLRAAGLNPILAAGSAGAGGVDVSSDLSVQNNQSSVGSMDDWLNLKYGKKQRQAEIDLLKSQEERQKADASAAKTNAETNQWQILNANDLKEAGLKFGIDIGGRFHESNAVRINKVTGECFDLKGRKLSPAVDNPSSPAPSKPMTLFDAVGKVEDNLLRKLQPNGEKKVEATPPKRKKREKPPVYDKPGSIIFTRGEDGKLKHRVVPWRKSYFITH